MSKIEMFPSSRVLTMDVGKLSKRRHHVYALLEVDVTGAYEELRSLKQAGSTVPVSFTAWFIKCVAKAASEHPHVHAIRSGRRGLMVFKEVDVSILVEKEVNGKKVPLPALIRDVDSKTLESIQSEINAAKQAAVVDESGYVLNKQSKRWQMRIFTALPQCLRLLAWRLMLRNPLTQKKMMGTVVVTSVGMMGASGWIIPSSIAPLAIALGSITEKPGVHEGQISIRRYLPITLVIDHDVVDGAPAARFADRLIQALKNAEVLRE